jgi:DNA repair protein RecO (recombination protein O)
VRSHSAEAYLLDVTDLQEGDRVLTFLTAEHGKKRGVARGAKRKHSRFAGQLQPLAKAVVSWFEKEGRDLVRVSSVELLRPSTAMRGELEDLLLAGYLAEHMSEMTVENEPADAQMRLLDASLDALLEGVPRAIVARYFETWALRLAGVFPPPNECAICGRQLSADARDVSLAPGGDGFADPGCAGEGARRVPSAVVDFLRRSARQSPTAMASAGVAQAALDGVEALCTEVRRGFLQRELRSYDVLRQVGVLQMNSVNETSR